jgi:predicted phosphodiesterase
MNLCNHCAMQQSQELLAKCAYQRGSDSVVLAGDLVNKGPKSQAVLQLAMREGFRAVRGNHDDVVLAAKLRVGRWRGMEELPAEHAWIDGLSR